LHVAAGANVAVGALRRYDRAGGLRVDGAAKELKSIAALGQQDARGVDQVQQAERNDDQRHHQGDAKHLLLFQGEAHHAPFVSSSLKRFSLLCSVFKLMPSISAARVLLPPAESSVAMISFCETSTT